MDEVEAVVAEKSRDGLSGVRLAGDEDAGADTRLRERILAHREGSRTDIRTLELHHGTGGAGEASERQRIGNRLIDRVVDNLSGARSRGDGAQRFIARDAEHTATEGDGRGVIEAVGVGDITVVHTEFTAAEVDVAGVRQGAAALKDEETLLHDGGTGVV